ncbi:MMPL family transporter [Winogradskya consettensis]|uniref:Membrane protein n=1 Tax=Winogradskya consettensis TaxID=113560 RepID=A0A919VRG0_9ACTN|nr:MMPL family transporter [Actinoplanes consettensis]GIM72850.1 membrane protein [Actinoplanes consettensis]
MSFFVRRGRLVLVMSAAALVVMAVLASGAFSALKSGGFDDPQSDSSRAAALLNRDFGGQTNLLLLVTPTNGAALDSPPVTALAHQITAGLAARGDVESISSYWDAQAAASGSEDGQAPASGSEDGQAAAPKGEDGQAAALKGEDGQAAAPRGEDGQAAAPRGEDGQAAAPKGEDGQAAAPKGEDGQAAALRGGDGQATAPRGGDGQATAPKGGDGQAAGLKGEDGRSALITMHVGGDEVASAAAAKAIVAAYATQDGPAEVRAGGQLGVGGDIGDQLARSLAIAEGIAVPVTLVLLILAFGSLMSALLPLVIGIIAVAGTFAELAVLGRLTDVSLYSVNLTTALGLGLAVDYSLLMVNRFREELRRGADVESAVATTVRTAGRTILFSSATVAVALAAMLLFPVYFLRSFAYAGIGVVVIAMVATLTTLPALLAVLGTRLAPRRAANDESVFWRRVATAVMRRPVAIALPVMAALLFLGTPVLHIAFGTPDDRVLHSSVPSRQVGDVLRANYAAATSTVDVLVTSTAPAASAGTARAVPDASAAGASAGAASAGTAPDAFAKEVAALPGVAGVRAPRTANGTAYLAVTARTDDEALVRAIRSLPAPAGTTVLVGGAAAALIDGNDAIVGTLPWAALWIALTTLILLFLFTGSVVLPVKALVLNVLSLSAVFGVLVWIFQDGHLSGPLGFTAMPVNTAMIVLMFCIAFGLSMDYEVFLLARIKEAHDHGAGTVDAVATGLARTGRIVTTAAALLAITFFAFGTAQVSFIQLFGIGTGIAIVLDATIIRGLLVPAFMRVAGDLNWWAPAPLRRLHNRIGLSEKDEPTPAALVPA